MRVLVTICVIILLVLGFIWAKDNLDLGIKDNDAKPAKVSEEDRDSSDSKNEGDEDQKNDDDQTENENVRENGAQYTFGKDKLFSADSPWNEIIEDEPVDPRSSYMMSLANERVGIIEPPNNAAPKIERRFIEEGVYINTVAWAPPVVVGGPETEIVCRQVICGEPPRSLPVPKNIDPDPRYDGWYTIIEGDTAYDLWRARREEDGTISYQYLREWKLTGVGHGKPGEVGARGSGLPLFAGLVNDQDLTEGEIDHALAIAIPGAATRNYVQPASVTDGNGTEDSLPMGARIRLKPDARLPEFDRQGKPIIYTREQRRTADTLLLALKKYGAIVVERAAVPTLYAQRDTTMLTGSELRGLTLMDFEVVKLGEILKDPPLAEVELKESQ